MILDHCTGSARLFSLCLLACALSGEAQQVDRKFAACIEIRQSTPSIIFIDDSGTTTEPQQFVIKAYGNPEDLKVGEVVFLEDDREIKVIPVGDLKPGVQTLTVPAGLHARTSSGLFSYSLVRLDGTDAIGVSGIPMSSVGHVPARMRKAPPKLKRDNHFADPGFEIATIDPDTDPNEAMAIAAFQPNEIGVTSTEGEISYTEGDDGPPQTLTIRGVNLKDGILVRFWTQRSDERVEATAPLTKTRVIATLRLTEPPLDDVVHIPTTLYESTVVVPASITHTFRHAFSIRSLNGKSRDRCE